MKKYFLTNYNSLSLLYFNLIWNSKEKYETCKKCFGEPTRRGAILRNLYNILPFSIKNSKFMNSLKD